MGEFKYMYRNNQSGAALFTALIFLLILTLIGVTALRNSGLSERMSTNSQISQMAFNAAESAANRYKAEYNYNVHVVSLTSQASAKNTDLIKYLPGVSLSTSAAGSSYFNSTLSILITVNLAQSAFFLGSWSKPPDALSKETLN